MEYGFFGLLVLAADIYALVNIFSSRASFATKAIWTLVVLILPVVGFLVWLLAGPRGKPASA